MSTKVVVGLVVVALVAFLICGGAGAFWYLKHQGPADVGPLSGQALALPADTALLGGFDAKGFFASPGYKQVASGDLPSTGKSPEEAAAAKKQFRENLEKGLAEGEAKLGVRIDRDVDRVVVGMSNVAAPVPDVVMLALGRFDKAKIKTAVEASIKGEGRTSTTRTVAGVEVIEMTEPGKPSVLLAVPDGGRLVLGSEGGVTAYLTAQAASKKPLEGNASLIGLVKGLDATSGYWLVADAPLVARGEKEAGPGAASMFPMPKNLTLNGKFSGSLTLAAEMADDAAAKQVSSMLDGGLAMVKGTASQNPQVEKVPGAKQMLDSLAVKAEGKKVTLSMSSPSGGGATLAGVIAEVIVPQLAGALGGMAGGMPGGMPGGEPGGEPGVLSEGMEPSPEEPSMMSDATPPPAPDGPPATEAPKPVRTPRPVRPKPVVRATPTPLPAAPEAPRVPSGPVRVGGDIREPRKVKNVAPVYPDLARRARVQGVVILECTISAQGTVSDVKVLRGQGMLDQAAIDAVRKWVYEPTLLNGTPVPVIMTVTVNFRLN
jgi:protein TonB